MKKALHDLLGIEKERLEKIMETVDDIGSLNMPTGIDKVRLVLEHFKCPKEKMTALYLIGYNLGQTDLLVALEGGGMLEVMSGNKNDGGRVIGKVIYKKM